MPTRQVNIGVADIDLGEEELEEIASAAENAAQARLRQAGRRVRDTLVTVDIQRSADNTITLSVDVAASGYSLGPLSYEELVEEAVDEAIRAAERVIKQLVNARKNRMLQGVRSSGGAGQA